MTFPAPSPLRGDSQNEERETSEVFDRNLSMNYFNIDSIYNLTHYARCLYSDGSNKIDLNDIELLIKLIELDNKVGNVEGLNTQHDALNALFWLASIVNEKFIQDCKDVIDEIDPKIRLNIKDIIAVFLNWGATLKTLGVDRLMPESEFKYSPPPDTEHLENQPQVEARRGTFNNGRFSTRTLEAVLAIIRQRLPSDSEKWVSHSKILLKLLATASLDRKYRSSRLFYTDAISAILESYSEWNIEKAQDLVAVMDIGTNANYFTCSLLVGNRTRIQQLSNCVAYKYIQLTTQSTPTPTSLPANLSQAAILLESPAVMIERHPYTSLIVMVDLYMHLLEDYVNECENNPVEEAEEKVRVVPIKTLHTWSLEARSILKHAPHKYILLANRLYQQANRLTSYTAGVLKNTFDDNILI